jgi:hypothetical protein
VGHHQSLIEAKPRIGDCALDNIRRWLATLDLGQHDLSLMTSTWPPRATSTHAALEVIAASTLCASGVPLQSWIGIARRDAGVPYCWEIRNLAAHLQATAGPVMVVLPRLDASSAPQRPRSRTVASTRLNGFVGSVRAGAPPISRGWHAAAAVRFFKAISRRTRRLASLWIRMDTISRYLHTIDSADAQISARSTELIVTLVNLQPFGPGLAGAFFLLAWL